MQEYQLRVIKEEEELSVKLNALVKFIHTEAFNMLDVVDKYLLLDQQMTMDKYRNILVARIARFQE